MKKLLFAALAVLALFSAPADAAQTQIAALVLSACATLPAGVTYAAGTYGILTMDTTGKLCDSATGGGGGGGLSVTDSASWTAGSSQFTPSGGEYNPTATALTSGQQGTLALDANRAAMVDVPTTNNNLYTALTSSIPAGTNNIGNVGSISQYPTGAVPITASATGTTTATTATLAANASLHTYICGFSIRANATGAATNNATVTGTVTGTLNFTQWTAPLASGLGVTEEVFSPCIISSAINTGVAVVSGAPGSGGVVSVTAWGYQL